MQVTILNRQNTILNRFISELRDVNIQNDPMRFRRNIERIGEIMSYEMSKTLHYKTIEVTTPLGTAIESVPSDQVVISSILRAGLPMHEGVLNYFDRSENAFVSAYRKYKEKTFDIHIEYISSPSLDGKILVLNDPMAATGSSIELAYRALLHRGQPSHTHILTIIASQAGVDYICEHLKDENVTLWIGAVDPELNSHSYIVPGLGDAGDLSYGTKL
jgi:uracil phosphoribosyltransferase